jgi:hypothetical protein
MNMKHRASLWETIINYKLRRRWASRLILWSSQYNFIGGTNATEEAAPFIFIVLYPVGELHSEELHNLYFSPSIIRMIKSRRMRWAGHVARIGGNRNASRILVGKPVGKRLLGRPRRMFLASLPSALQLRMSFGLLNNQPPFLSVLHLFRRRSVEW